MKSRNNKIALRKWPLSLGGLAFCIFGCTFQVASADTSSSSAAETPPVFKMWLGSGLPKMQSFDQAIVESLLENSREKFGDYKFVSEIAMSNTKRQERIFHSSIDVSINVSPMNSLYNDSTEGGYGVVPFPIAKGMLGYRQVLVKKERLQEFSQIKTLKDLQAYSIGQVSGWADIEVLQENKIDVRAIPKYELLFPMLKSNRFDSISVGCTEVPALMKFLNENYPDKFELVPDLVLFYPFSLYIFVNRNQHNALERLTLGYERAYNKGDIDKIFNVYHGELFQKLKTPGLKIIQLKNTQISARGADLKPSLLD